MNASHQLISLNRNTDILTYAEHFGLIPDSDLKTICFMEHSEYEKTLHFDSDNQAFYCTSPTCRVHGNTLDLIRFFKGRDLGSVLETISEISGTDSMTEIDTEEFIAVNEIRDCLNEAGRFYASNLEHALPYLEERGIGNSTAERFLIGVTKGTTGLKDHLVSMGHPEYVIEKAGLLNRYGNDFFQERIIVPIRIYGQIISFYGRALDPDAEIKHLRMSGNRVVLGSYPFNWNYDREEIIVTEGIFDALALIEKGFTNAVAYLGTQGFRSGENMAALRQSNVKKIYLCFDGDESGKKAALRDSYTLEDNGYEAGLVDIDNQDPNEFILSKGSEAFKERLEASQLPVQWEINGIDPELEVEKKITELQNVFRRCKLMQPLLREATVERLVKVLGVPKRTIEKHIDSMEDDGLTLFSPHSSHEYVCVHPALDFVDGMTLMMVCQQAPNPGKGTKKWLTFAVTSERDMFPLDTDTMSKRNYYMETDVMPFRPRYSLGIVKAFLDGKKSGDIRLTYKEIHSVMQYYLDFEDTRTYDYLTTWIIGTYFFPLFNYYPYIHFTGTKNVGKSKTMSLLACLCFNAVFSTSMTSAALFRAVDSWRSTVLMDETEYLHHNEFSDKRLILNGGFQKGSYVSRTEKERDQHVVRMLHNYSPKAFASIEGLDDTLASRTVQIYMHRSNDTEIKEREVTIESPDFQNIRNQLFLTAMSHGKLIHEMYSVINKPNELEFGDREFNLFKPILTIGAVVDLQNVTDNLIGFANASYRQKMLIHNDTAEENVLLRYLLDFITEDGWFRGDVIHDGFINFLKNNGLDVGRQISKSRLGQLIRKLKIVTEDKRSTDRKTTNYLIRKEELQKVAQNYQVM